MLTDHVFWEEQEGVWVIPGGAWEGHSWLCAQGSTLLWEKYVLPGIDVRVNARQKPLAPLYLSGQLSFSFCHLLIFISGNRRCMKNPRYFYNEELELKVEEVPGDCLRYIIDGRSFI